MFEYSHLLNHIAWYTYNNKKKKKEIGKGGTVQTNALYLKTTF